jgi:membrane protease YdiL (CAAX protease family)
VERNTKVALAYWLALLIILFAAAGTYKIYQSVSIMLGFVYVLLVWSPLLIVKYIERRPITSLGLGMNSPLRTLLWGVGAFILVSMFFVIEVWYKVNFGGKLLGSVAQPIYSLWIELISQLMLIGLPEELASRGYLLTRLRESWGALPALVISSALFGAGHLTMGDVPRAIQAGLSGFVYGLAFIRTRGIYAPMLSHILQNLFSSSVARIILS